MHIWPPTKLYYITWSFSFDFTQYITFDHLRKIHLFLRSMLEIFDISVLRVSLWLLGPTHFHYKSLSLFPNQILVSATTFAAHYVFFRFDICWVIKQKHKRVGRYIGTSLCMSQDQQNYWLIIHDKFENLFTTIT